MQPVASAVIARHINVVHDRLQGKLPEGHLEGHILPVQPALPGNPRVFQLPLLVIHKLLPEQPVVVIQPHAVPAEIQRGDRIQEAGGETAQASVSQ